MSAPALIIAALSLSTAPAPSPPAPPAPTELTFLDTRFTAANAIIVRVLINGAHPVNLILDTGAPLTFLDDDVAARLGLALKPSPRRQGYSLAEMVSLELRPGTSLALDRVEVKDLFSYTGTYHHSVEGMLGMDVISRFVLRIDYSTQTIEILPKVPDSSTGREWVRLELPANGTTRLLAWVALSANGAQAPDYALLGIDSANTGSINIFDDTPVAARLIGERPPPIDGPPTAWNGPGWCDIDIAFPKLAFARASPVEITPRHPFTHDWMHGFIGGSFLAGQSPVILDAANRVLLLSRQPNTDAGAHVGGRARGMTLYGFDGHLGAMVSTVRPGSAAGAAGVLADDHIIAIDGIPATSDSLRWIPRYLDIVRDREVLLAIMRDKQYIEVRVGPAANCLE